MEEARQYTAENRGVVMVLADRRAREAVRRLAA